MNRDSPDGVGYFETLELLRDSYPDQVCHNPSGISVKTENNLPIGNIIVDITPEFGVVCLNSKNENGCPDLQNRVFPHFSGSFIQKSKKFEKGKLVLSKR